MTDREILLSFIGSLTLCDHMGDVADDVCTTLKLLGLEEIAKEADNDTRDDFWLALSTVLGKRGIKTLYGTNLI